MTVSAMQCLESFMEQAMLDYTFTGAGTEKGREIAAGLQLFPAL